MGLVLHLGKRNRGDAISYVGQWSSFRPRNTGILPVALADTERSGPLGLVRNGDYDIPSLLVNIGHLGKPIKRNNELI